MAKIASKGTKLWVNIGITMTEIPQVSNISQSGVAVEETQVSDLNQSAAGHEYMPNGYAEGGSFSFDRYLDPAGVVDKALTALVTTPKIENFELRFANAGATVWPFAGIYKGPNVTAAMPDALVTSNEVKVNGLVAYPV